MTEKVFHVSFRHPVHDTVLALELPASATFREILKQLYETGFIRRKPADYKFIIGRRLCAMNKSLGSYVPPEADEVEVRISGLLTIIT